MLSARTACLQVAAPRRPACACTGGHKPAAAKFGQADRYVTQRLRSLMVKKLDGQEAWSGLACRQVLQCNKDWFNGLGLHRLRGAIRYPKTV
jgi:hypothetical protein